MAKTKAIQLESTMRKLELVIEKLDDENVSLEESLAAFEEGIKLTRSAQDALAAAEQKVRLLLEKNGDPEELLLPDDNTEDHTE